jgi:magnesium-transporting ATPase (P-type)
VRKSLDEGVVDASVADVDAVAEDVGGNVESGLSSAEAARRLAESGPNSLRTAPPVPIWRRALAQFRDPLVYLLIAATVVSLVAWIAGACRLPIPSWR